MPEDVVTIRLADTGQLLGGRPLAAQLRQHVTETAAAHAVIVDFEGIQAMSPSFADELFAKLDQQLLETGRVQLRDADSQFKALVDVMITQRRRAAGG